MRYQEDLTIENKYLNLENMAIYDVEKDRHGIIIGIELFFSVRQIFVQFVARYDNINNRDIIFINDFVNGKMKFVLLKGGMWESEPLKKSQEEELQNLKDVFESDYTDDMVMWVDEEDRKTKLEEQKHRQKQYIGSQLVNLDSFAEEVVYDSYSTLQAFCLYTDGIIDEKQMLYAMVNTLAAEKRVERDMRLKDAHETFSADIRKALEENGDLLKELIKRNVNPENEVSE